MTEIHEEISPAALSILIEKKAIISKCDQLPSIHKLSKQANYKNDIEDVYEDPDNVYSADNKHNFDEQTTTKPSEDDNKYECTSLTNSELCRIVSLIIAYNSVCLKVITFI